MPERPRPGRCPRCFLQPAFCLCADLPEIVVEPTLVVVRHWRERTKTSNTGRVLALAVRDSVVRDYGVWDEPFDSSPALVDGAWLVFPAGSDEAEDRPPPPSVPTEAPKAIVLLDGTWGQARRMSHRIPGLAALPRLAIGPPRPGVQRLRSPHAPWAVSTIEAAALALQAVGDPAACDALHDVFALFWTRVRAQAGLIPDPRRVGRDDGAGALREPEPGKAGA